MVLWLIAAFCAYFVKGLCGFANTLVFTTVLSFGVSNVSISPVDLLIGCPSNAVIAWRGRRLIQWKVCLPLAGLLLLGAIPGVFFLKSADSRIVKMLFGALIVFIGVKMLVEERLQTRAHKENKLILLCTGLLSGVLCGLYGVGALLCAHVSRATKDSAAFKATICTLFFIENVFRIAAYLILGVITQEALKMTLIVLPAVFLGLFLGIYSCKFLNEKVSKLVVICMLIVSGAALVLNNI